MKLPPLALLALLALLAHAAAYRIDIDAGTPTIVEVTKYRLPEISFTVSNDESDSKGWTLAASTWGGSPAVWLVSDEDYPVDAAHAKWTITSDKTGNFVWTVPACDYKTLAREPETISLFMTLDVSAAPPPTGTEEIEFILHNDGPTEVVLSNSPSKTQYINFDVPVCAPDSALIIRVPAKAEAAGSLVEVTFDPSDSILPFEFDSLVLGIYEGPTAFECPSADEEWDQDEWADADAYSEAVYHGFVLTWTQDERPAHHCPTVPVTLAMMAGTRSDPANN